MAPKRTTPTKRGAAAASAATAASSRPPRKTTMGAFPSAVSPPAAAPLANPVSSGERGDGQAAELPVATGDKVRPLFSNPRLEDHIRTRIRDLEYILSGIDGFKAERGLKDVLEPSMGMLRACIESLEGVTPEVGLGFGLPDGDPLSSLAGSPPRGPRGGRPTVKAPAVKKATAKGPDGGVAKTASRGAARGGNK